MAKKNEINVPSIIERFNRFNKEYFSNELKTPNFRISTTKTMLGQCAIKKNIPTISVSNYYDVEDTELNNTIIHEMIHLYQWQKYKKMSHLATFKDKAKEISILSNGVYNITRTSKRDLTKLSADGQKRAERIALNGKKPIWVLAIERNKDRDPEYAWLICVTEKYYNEIFNYGCFRRFPNIEIVGFLYDVPATLTSKIYLPTCRNRVRGKKQEWTAFCEENNYIISNVTKKHKDNCECEFEATFFCKQVNLIKYI